MKSRFQNFGKTVCLAVLLTVSSTIASFALPFGGGDGSTINPYKIMNINHLNELKNDVNNYNAFSGKYFILCNDISGFTGMMGSVPYKPFMGNFNGNGKKITVDIYNPLDAYVGLFNYIDRATIKNLTVDGFVIGEGCIGGIAGRVEAGSTIENCTNLATVSTSFLVSNGGGNIGGIGGYCHYGANFIECANAGHIVGLAGNVGGIVGNGHNGHLILRCVNIGTVEGNLNVGGIIGGTTRFDVIVSHCMNAGNVKGTGAVGGIYGYNPTGCAIRYCLNVGVVEGPTGQAGTGNSGTGGIAGNNLSGTSTSNIINCVYDRQTSPYPLTANGTMNINGTYGKNTKDIIGSNLSGMLGMDWDYDCFSSSSSPMYSHYPVMKSMGNKIRVAEATDLQKIAASYLLINANDTLPNAQNNNTPQPYNNIQNVRYFTARAFSPASWDQSNVICTIVNTNNTNGCRFIRSRSSTVLYARVGNIKKEVPINVYSLRKANLLNSSANGTFTVSEIMPNIVTENAKVDVTVAESGNLNVSIYDLSGNKLMNVFDGFANENSTVKVDLNNLSNLVSGTYTVIIKTENDSAIRKFIKK